MVTNIRNEHYRPLTAREAKNIVSRVTTSVGVVITVTHDKEPPPGSVSLDEWLKTNAWG
jgi:hypothetical protein